MLRYIEQIKYVQNQFNGLPICCAGDVFHKWNSSAELINFLITNLPEMYAIPGQHDLPHHRYADIRKSAYWTLVKANKIYDIHWTHPQPVNGVYLWGVPWGEEIPKIDINEKKRQKRKHLDLAVVHRYLYTDETGFPGAPPENHINTTKKELNGYDAAVFGDNHVGFLAEGIGECPSILNCGGFMRRNSDQMDYRPHIAILYENGKIIRYPLDTSKDVFIDRTIAKPLEDKKLDLSKFVSELKGLGEASIKFGETVRRFMMLEKLNPEVIEILHNVVPED
jgi:hypothetical protein